jgi:CBS domain-containing protein
MEGETAEIHEFLSAHPPFSVLPDAVIKSLPHHIEAIEVAGGHDVLKPEDHIRSLYLVRSGVIELRSPHGDVWAHRDEGETFGVRALLENGRAAFYATAIESSVLYLLPDTEFARLRLEYPEFDRFFAPIGADRLRGAQPGDSVVAREPVNSIALRVRDLTRMDHPTIRPEVHIDDAVRTMRDQQTHCLPVVAEGTLVGLLTDANVRDGVVAAAAQAPLHVSDIMTPAPVVLSADDLAFDALLTATEQQVSHLPVTKDGRFVGVATQANLASTSHPSAAYLTGEIHRRRTVAGLAEIVAQIPYLLVILVETGVTSHNIGRIITSVADATTYRLLQLTEERIGPPPVPYVWLASGSQARQEQMGVSDQDNCLVLDDAYDVVEHGPYFERLANAVCGGLDACGYIYCPGDMMAMNPKWRQPRAQWESYFTSWIEEPEPMAQMLSSVLFDLRPIRGETRLFDDLQAITLEKARSNSIFLAHMVSNALTHSPPLGFFRNFVLIRDGEHKRQFDLKHSGTVPIIDIARVCALQVGSACVNTEERLMAGQQAHVLSETGLHDLLDAFEFLLATRLKHQSRQVRSGQKPDNFMTPADLSRSQRTHLREAFLSVKAIQSSLANTYHVAAR